LTLDPTRPDAPKAKNFVTQLDPDPTQSDPWMNPTHVQFWFVVTTAKLRETSRNFQSNRSVALRLCYWIATCQHLALQWGAVFHLVYYAPDRREWGNKRCFCPSVRLSVRLSVRRVHSERIIREPKGIACPTLERRFSTFDVTRIPDYQFQGQTVKGQG